MKSEASFFIKKVYAGIYTCKFNSLEPRGVSFPQFFDGHR